MREGALRGFGVAVRPSDRGSLLSPFLFRVRGRTQSHLWISTVPISQSITFVSSLRTECSSLTRLFPHRLPCPFLTCGLWPRPVQIRPTLQLMGLSRLTFPGSSSALRDSLSTAATKPLSIASLASISSVVAHATLPYLLAPILFFGPLYCLALDRELPWQACGRSVGESVRFLRVMLPPPIRRWWSGERGREARSVREKVEEVQDWVDYRNYAAVRLCPNL